MCFALRANIQPACCRQAASTLKKRAKNFAFYKVEFFAKFFFKTAIEKELKAPKKC